MMQLIMNSIFGLTCLVVNTLHLIQLFQEYFAYDVTTNVIVELPDQLIFPDLVFCFELQDVIDWEHLSLEDFRSLIDPEDSEEMNEFYQELKNISRISDDHVKQIYKLMKNESNDISIKKFYSKPSYILENMTKNNLFAESYSSNSSALFDELLIYSENINDRIPISNQTHFHQYFDFSSFLFCEDKCYVIRKKQNIKLDFNFLKEYGNTFSIINIIIFELFMESKKRSTFMIIPPGYPATQSLESFILNSKAANKYTFDVSESTLLPFPYKTKCFNYSSSSITQEGCRHDCRKQEFLRRKGFFLSNTIINREDITGKMQEYHDEIGINELNDVSKKCQKQCIQKDCHLITFNNKRKLEDKLYDSLTHDVDNYMAILIEASYNNIIKTETLPAIPIFVFITNFLSTFGIYSGISLFSFQRMIVKAAKYILDKSQVKRGSNLKENIQIQRRIVRLKLVQQNY